MSESEIEQPAKCWLYHPSCPGGQVFTGDDAIEDALESGWQDTPPDEATVMPDDHVASEDLGNVTNSAAFDEALETIEDLQQKLAAAEAQTDRAAKQIGELEKQISTLKGQNTKLQKKLDAG